MSPDPKDLYNIAAALVRRGVDFVAIGGWAAEAQGYNLGYVTQDIDFTPERDRGNLDRLSAALKDLNAAVRFEEEAFAFDHIGDTFETGMVWNLVCDFGKFDLSFDPTAMGGYDGLINTAQPVTVIVDGEPVIVMCADIEDIIRSKKTVNREKDRLSVPHLEEQLRIRRRAGRDDDRGLEL